MKRILVLAMFVVSAVALGQNADANSAGPTKNDYRLRLIEPAEGATVTGPTVRVVVNTEIPAQPGSQNKTDVDTMPRPDVKVFLDNEQKGVLKDRTNVLTLDSVAPGSHKIVVVATNRSGEVIDRKEVSFTSTEAVSTASKSTTTSESTTYSSQPAPAPPPAPAARPVVRETKSTAPAPAPPPPAEPAKTLPKTGSSFPLAAAAGAGLLVLGLALRKRS